MLFCQGRPHPQGLPGAISALVNIHAALDGQTFLTKRADLLMMRGVNGLDYECRESTQLNRDLAARLVRSDFGLRLTLHGRVRTMPDPPADLELTQLHCPNLNTQRLPTHLMWQLANNKRGWRERTGVKGGDCKEVLTRMEAVRTADTSSGML
jgi:hypothetical protein